MRRHIQRRVECAASWRALTNTLRACQVMRSRYYFILPRARLRPPSCHFHDASPTRLPFATPEAPRHHLSSPCRLTSMFTHSAHQCITLRRCFAILLYLPRVPIRYFDARITPPFAFHWRCPIHHGYDIAARLFKGVVILSTRILLSSGIAPFR